MSIRIIFFCYCITPLVCLAERNVSAQLKDGWIIVAQGNDENFQQVKVKVWGADRIAGKFYQLDADPEKEFVVISRGIGTGPYYKLQIIDFLANGILTWAYSSSGAPKIENGFVFWVTFQMVIKVQLRKLLTKSIDFP